ncbi:vacuolar membrane-associated protein iml1 [Podila horticola]|nr:vacuolar membrane-associated protein iml1 [Podila horticola]
MNSTSSNHDGPSQSTSAGPPSNATKILYHHTDHFSRRDFLIDPAYFPNVQPNDLFEIYDPALPKEQQKSLIIQWTGVDNSNPLKQPVQVPSGYITSDTRIIFRSESAKYFIFIQMSREMWEFDEDGEIFFERVIFGFLPNLFARWRGKRDGKTELDAPTNHVVSIVLFSRIFYQEEEEARFRIDGYPGEQTGLQRDDEGRYYQDFYKVVIDWEARQDWTTAIIPLKEEVMRYQRDILLRPHGQYSILSGENSFAFEGNVLESINLALNSLDKHYVDRDLQRTGLSIVMITPGSGMFDVDKKLLRLTTERMISGGIGLDMICLSKIPAHIVPLFRWKGPLADSNGLASMSQGSGHSPSTFSMANNTGSNLMVRSSSAFSRPNSRPPSIKESSGEARPTTPWTRAYKSNTTNPMPEVQLDMSDPLYYDAPVTFPSSATKTYYMMPHWVDCMFYVSSRKPNPQKFYTRCKMYELQMMGIMEHEISSISIPYLNETYNTQYSTPFGKRLTSSDALVPRSNPRSVDFDKHDDDIFHDSNSLLSGEIRQLNSSSHSTRGMIRDALSLDNLEVSGARTPTTGRYLGGTNHQSISNYSSKMTSELSRSLPRAWNTTLMTGAIPEHQALKDMSAVPGKVSFSLKSANGFLEESRSGKQSDKQNMDDDETQGAINGQRRAQDDSAVENYGRSSSHYIDIKHRSGHIRASTDDDPGFLSSSTVKPIYIARNHRMQDDAPSEISAADSCNTGSLSSDKGNRTFISNPSGGGGRIIQTRQRSKQTHINPCNPPKTIIRMTSHLRRWQHAFPRVRARSSSPNLIRSEVYTDGLSNTEAWRGLMSPASLPLTTDYFPTKEELQELYSEYIHTISPSEASSYHENDQERLIRAQNLRKELIYHRLAQGFQLIVESSPSSKSQAGFKNDTSSSDNRGHASASEGAMTLTRRGGATAAAALASGSIPQMDAASREFPGKDSGSMSGGSGNATKDRGIYLSMGQQVHRLSIDNADGNVEVKRYERRLGYKPEAIKYQCVIWAKQLPGYLPRDLSFTYPSLSNYQWNYLDSLVSGYQDELTEDLMYWRARFLLIPTENIATNSLTNVVGEQLDEEELRLAGFQKFLDLFQKARYCDPENEPVPRPPDISVKVQLITCSFAAWASSELSKKEFDNNPTSFTSSSSAEPEKLSKTSKIQTIATAIQNPLTGVKLQDRRWHLRVYNSVFLGNEVVDWLIHNFNDIDTREDATDFGKKLFEKGLFIHCLGKHHFMDGHYFYQFSGEYAPSGKQTRGWFRNTTQSLTRRDVDLDKLKKEEPEPSTEKLVRPALKMSSGSTSGTTPTLSNTSGALTTISGAQSTNAVPSFRERMEMLQKMAPPKTVDMSKTLTIDVDPNKRSDRRETAVLHYDLAHNIKHCYHFQLHWLGCTARLIEDMLQSWGRVADKCGLRLIEAPIKQDSQGRAFNPFEAPVPIKLALRPPATKGFFKPASQSDPLTEPVQVPKLHFFTELVKLHGFILDMESDELYPPANQLKYSYRRAPYKNIQYVHRGSTSKSASNHTPNPEVLRRKFTATCNDKEELTRIWDEISSHLETISGIQDILEDVPDESVVEREGLAWVMPSLAAPRRNSEVGVESGSQEPSSANGSGESSESSKTEGEGGSTPTTPASATPSNVPIIRIDMDPASQEEDIRREQIQTQAQAQGQGAETEALVDQAAPQPTAAVTSSESSVSEASVAKANEPTVPATESTVSPTSVTPEAVTDPASTQAASETTSVTAENDGSKPSEPTVHST